MASAVLNMDVLDTIFSHLDNRNLASTALACRSWVYPSQRRLYHRVHFTDGRFRRDGMRGWMTKLASTLTGSDHIRNLIRSLRVECWGTVPDPEPLYQWLLLLPPKRIHSMAIMGRSNELRDLWFVSTVLSCPALPGVRHLVTEGVFQYSKTGYGLVASRRGFTVESFAHLPLLESLRIDDYSFPLLQVLGPTSQFTPLKRFNAHIHTYDKSVRTVVQQYRGSLLHLALSIDSYAWEGWSRDIVDILIEDLSTFTRLRHLFMFSAQFGHHHGPSSPFMDEVVKYLPELETLYCGAMSFSGDLLERIPRTLRTLRLETTTPYSEEIMSACTRRQMGVTSLRLLELGDPQFPNQPKHSFQLIAQCAEAGITLRLLHVNDWDNRDWADDTRAFAV